MNSLPPFVIHFIEELPSVSHVPIANVKRSYLQYQHLWERLQQTNRTLAQTSSHCCTATCHTFLQISTYGALYCAKPCCLGSVYLIHALYAYYFSPSLSFLPIDPDPCPAYTCLLFSQQRADILEDLQICTSQVYTKAIYAANWCLATTNICDTPALQHARALAHTFSTTLQENIT